jgi:hypothetical protein
MLACFVQWQRWQGVDAPAWHSCVCLLVQGLEEGAQREGWVRGAAQQWGEWRVLWLGSVPGISQLHWVVDCSGSG